MEDDIGTTSFFATPIYKIEEKVGVLESRLEEIEDIERHVLDKLDQAAADEKKAIRGIDRAKIVDVENWLRNKAAMLGKDKKQIVTAMKKLLAVLPAEERLNVLRRLKIEYRFNSVKEMIQDATTASGFTQEQIEEFHKQQINRAKIEKKQAEARRKLAQAELEKHEAQKKAKEAVKLAKAKEAEKKAVAEVKNELKQAKKEEKKSDKVMNQLIQKAKEETKSQNKKAEKLQEKVKKLAKKPQDSVTKAKLDVATKQLAAAKALQKADSEKVKKLINEKYNKKIATEKASVEKIQEELKKTTGNNKSQLEQKLLAAKSALEQTEKKKTQKLSKA